MHASIKLFKLFLAYVPKYIDITNYVNISPIIGTDITILCKNISKFVLTKL